MADLVATGQTTLPHEEVIARAVQFFTNENWRTQTQSEKIVTFVGRPPLSSVFVNIVIAILFIWTVIVPIIMYFMTIKEVLRFQNVVVTVNPGAQGTEVTVTHPKRVKKMINRFLGLLPVPEAAS